MIDALRALLGWWSTDTFVKTGAMLIALGVGYFLLELLSAATVDPFIQFWIGVALSVFAYGASWWYQQVAQRAVLWHMVGFLTLIATMCWLQFTYAILNPWFVCIVCGIALWRLFFVSHEHRSAMVLAAGFFGGALVPPIIFAEQFTPMVTTMSFVLWWTVGLLVSWLYRAWQLFNWVSLTFILLITVFVWLTDTTISVLTALPIVVPLCVGLLLNTLSFHGVFKNKAVSSRWYETAIATVLLAAVIWMPNSIFAGVLGAFALLTFTLAALRYYPVKLVYHSVTFVLATAAYLAAIVMLLSPTAITALIFVWTLYTLWWIGNSYPRALLYSIALWLVPAAAVVWYQLLTPAVVIGLATTFLTGASAALVKQRVALGTLYFVLGWTLLIAGIVYLFLPLTITSAFFVLSIVGILGVITLLVSIVASLPVVFFLVSLGSTVAGLCSVYLLGNAELLASSYHVGYFMGVTLIWFGLVAAFLSSYKKQALVKAAVLWTLIAVASLPTVLMVVWLFVPGPFVSTMLLCLLVHALLVLRSVRVWQLALPLVPWMLLGVVGGALAMTLVLAFSITYSLSALLTAFLSAGAAIVLVLGIKKSEALLKKQYLLQYVIAQLTAWVAAVVVVTIVAARMAPSGQSSLYILGVLLLASYILTYFARVWNDWGLHRVSFAVLLLVLTRVLSVEAWQLPNLLVLVPFLIAGIILISLTMKRHNSTLY